MASLTDMTSQYPYVTSSNTGLGGIFTGLAINPRKIREIVGYVSLFQELGHDVSNVLQIQCCESIHHQSRRGAIRYRGLGGVSEPGFRTGSRQVADKQQSWYKAARYRSRMGAYFKFRLSPFLLTYWQGVSTGRKRRCGWYVPQMV